MRENVNTIVFAVGLTLTCAGLWGWFSWHVAAVFAGCALLCISVFPYLRMRYPR